MGWVRGQTGERKRKEKQSKDLPGLGSSRVRAGRHWLGCGAGCPQESCIHRVGEGPDRCRPPPDCGPSRGPRVGAAQSLPATGKGAEGRVRKGREAQASSRDPGASVLR